MFKSHFIIFIYYKHEPEVLMQNHCEHKSDGSQAAHVWLDKYQCCVTFFDSADGLVHGSQICSHPNVLNNGTDVSHFNGWWWWVFTNPDIIFHSFSIAIILKLRMTPVMHRQWWVFCRDVEPRLTWLFATARAFLFSSKRLELMRSNRKALNWCLDGNISGYC